jgi:hypothetical protein
MIIRIKYEGKIQNCDVLENDCKTRECFVPHRYTHNNKTIDGCSAVRRDKCLSCATRNYKGCPDKYCDLQSKE